MELRRPVLELRTEVRGRAFTLGAPIDSADLLVSEEVSLTLGIAIDKVSAGNFLLDAALRGFLVSAGAQELFFAGTGALSDGAVQIEGLAKAGQVLVEMALDVAPAAAASAALAVDITGSAVFKDVNVPIPGVGSLDELELAVRAHLDLVLNR